MVLIRMGTTVKFFILRGIQKSWVLQFFFLSYICSVLFSDINYPGVLDFSSIAFGTCICYDRLENALQGHFQTYKVSMPMHLTFISKLPLLCGNDKQRRGRQNDVF